MIVDPDAIKQIQLQVAKNRLDDALENSAAIFRDPLSADLLRSIRRRKAELDEKRLKGTLSNDLELRTTSEIADAILQLCRQQEKATRDDGAIVATEGRYERMPLAKFPVGPMVESYFIDEIIIEAYAKIIRPAMALSIINKANRLRRSVDPTDDRVTTIEHINLMSPANSRPVDFWMDAFHEAGLNGPRMLAALLYVLPDDQFSEKVTSERRKLLVNLLTHK